MAEKKRGHRGDLILIGGILVIALLAFAVTRLMSGTGAYVEIQVAGETVTTLPLGKNTTYDIEGINGGHNYLTIEDGEAYLTDATCPDGLCIDMGPISKNRESMICLPNQVVVQVIDENASEDENTVDAVTGR